MSGISDIVIFPDTNACDEDSRQTGSDKNIAP
jgi:hypothetical protein